MVYAHIYTYTFHIYKCACMHVCVFLKNASGGILYALLYTWSMCLILFLTQGQIFVFTMTFHLWVHVNVYCKSVQFLLCVTQAICKMTHGLNHLQCCFLHFKNGKEPGFCPLRVTVSVISLLAASALTCWARLNTKLLE